MNLISVQSADWYDVLFGDENAEAAFRFMKDCGFDAVDDNLDQGLEPPQIRAHKRCHCFNKKLLTNASNGGILREVVSIC